MHYGIVHILYTRRHVDFDRRLISYCYVLTFGTGSENIFPVTLLTIVKAIVIFVESKRFSAHTHIV